MDAQQNTDSNEIADLNVPNFIRVYSIDAIGGEQVETYKNDTQQYFYNPLIIVDWNYFKDQLDKKSSQSEDTAVRLLLKVYHYDKKVYEELKMRLERDENIRNISLSFLPYSYYVIKARVGDDYKIINPTDLPTFSTIGNFQIKHMIRNERNYEISGSLKQLIEFYDLRSSNDNLTGSLYIGGFEFSSDYVKGTADFATSSTIRKKLFGDETLIDNQVVNSSSSEGGLSLSLGPLKFGGGNVDSKVWTENEKKRILNRNYVSDLISENKTEIHILSIGDADKVREIKSEIMKYLLEKVASQVTLEFQKISSDEYNLVKDNLHYATLKGDQVEKLLQAKPQSKVTSSSDKEGSYAGASGSSKDNIITEGSDDITWQYKGTEWVPTKVDMYILSELQLKNSLSIDALSYNKQGQKTIEIPFIFPAAWLENRSQNLNSGIVDRDNPIGSILAFAANADQIPAGWRLCNGDALPPQGNEELFNVIGYNWGQQPNGDFNLPDLRGVFLRGVDYNRNLDLDRQRSATQGLIVNDYQDDAFKKHNHGIRHWRGSGGQGGDELSQAGHLVDRHVTEGGSENETRPKNVAVTYIIRS